MLKHWADAGLSQPSLVRCSKINTISPGQAILKIGQLHREDLMAVRDGVKLYISQGFEQMEENIGQMDENVKLLSKKRRDET